MTEENIQASLAHFEAQLRQWQANQHQHTDAYEFEKSFVVFAQDVARKTLELAVESEYKGRNHKKK